MPVLMKNVSEYRPVVLGRHVVPAGQVFDVEELLGAEYLSSAFFANARAREEIEFVDGQPEESVAEVVEQLVAEIQPAEVVEEAPAEVVEEVPAEVVEEAPAEEVAAPRTRKTRAKAE